MYRVPVNLSTRHMKEVARSAEGLRLGCLMVMNPHVQHQFFIATSLEIFWCRADCISLCDVFKNYVTVLKIEVLKNILHTINIYINDFHK